MSESIYAPPDADVSAPPSVEGDRYYVVGTTKFWLLSIFTFTIYFVYWFYRNWKLIKTNDASDIWPVPRAIFYIFFTHSLFADVDIRVKDRDAAYSWQPTLIATIVVVLAILGNVVDRVIPAELFTGWLLLTPFVMTLALTYLLSIAQKAINFASGDDEGASNSKLSAANYAWLALGVLWWAVVLIGLAVVFNPEFLT